MNHCVRRSWARLLRTLAMKTAWALPCALLVFFVFTASVQAVTVTLGWDASATPQPLVEPPDELRYLVEQRLPGTVDWLQLLPGVPLTQLTFDVPLAEGDAGTQHCFQVRTVQVRLSATPVVIIEESPPAFLQGSPTETALCVPAAVAPEPASQVAFATHPQTTGAGATMPPMTTQLQNSDGALIATATDTVTLSLAGILVPQGNITVTSVDSEDAGYEKEHAIDGNPSLFWHTQWVAAQPAHPHQIILNLGASYSVVGLTYQPRADQQTGGNILQYAVYVSTDGSTWGAAVTTGSLTPQVKTHGITWTPKTGQYLRLVALSEVNGDPYTNANELHVVVASAVALGGDLTQAGVAGVATFNDITVPTPGVGYVFRATSGSLREDLAAPVTITAAPVTATKLAFGVQPANRGQNAALPTVTVQVQDASSTVVTSATHTITLAEASVGAAITGDVSNAAVAGVAAFPGLSLPAVGTARQLRATASGLTDATSALFDITAVSGAPRLTANSLVYRGAFRLSRNALPRAEAGGYPIYWSGAQGPIAYHQTRKTLYMLQSQGHILELNIPPLRAPATVAELAIATHAQPAIDMTQGQWANLGAGGVAVVNGAILGGIAFHNGAMILSATPYYAPGSVQVVSHSTASPTWALSGRQWSGWKAVGAPGKGGFVGGWMVPIPSEWQSALGGRPYFTGQGAIPIIDRTSFGPALSTFDPAAIGGTSPVPVTPIVEYPSAHPTLGGYGDTPSLPFNRTASVGGAVFPAGTSTVLFLGAVGVGQTGLGNTCYGDRTTVLAAHDTIVGGERVCYDLANGDKGPHGYPYITQAMAYDANDLVKVQIGQMQPWEPVPYATWELTLPFAHPERKVCGVSYDEAGKQLFVCQLKGDSTSPSQPLIHVFTVTIP